MTVHLEGYTQQQDSELNKVLFDSCEVLIKARDFENALKLNRKDSGGCMDFHKDTFWVAINQPARGDL